ncbi:UPAR/Ly6 domain-containing protein crok-like [Ornithodoros turicata]
METAVYAFVTALSLCLCLLLGTGSAIKCWECNSRADPRCEDPFDNTTLPISECKARSLIHYPGLEATMCRKIRQKVYGSWRFIRSCAFLGVPGEGTYDENYCLMRTGTYDVFVETCTCNSKDGCNPAPRTRATAWLLLSLGAVVPGIFLLNR